MRTEFGWILATVPAASIRVEFESARHEVVDYAVILLVDDQGDQRMVRLYDGSHGINECTDTPDPAASSRRRSFTTVRLEKA